LTLQRRWFVIVAIVAAAADHGGGVWIVVGLLGCSWIILFFFWLNEKKMKK
jgi:hypothetical protein